MCARTAVARWALLCQAPVGGDEPQPGPAGLLMRQVPERGRRCGPRARRRAPTRPGPLPRVASLAPEHRAAWGAMRGRKQRARLTCSAVQLKVSESPLTFLGGSGVPSRGSVGARALGFRPRAPRGAGAAWPRERGRVYSWPPWFRASLKPEALCSLWLVLFHCCFILFLFVCFLFVAGNGIRTSCFSEVSGDGVGTNRTHRGTLFPCSGGGSRSRTFQMSWNTLASPPPASPDPSPHHSSPPSYQNVPHHPRVSLDDACSYVQHQINIAERGH